MSDQPKPTSEWTAERVWKRITDYADNCEDAIGDLAGDTVCIGYINAALAANDHKWNLARLTDIKEITDKCAGQLAAEREKVKLMEYRLSETEIRFREQLAAERRASEVKWNEAVAARDINHLNRIQELEKQLTAEREGE